MDLSMEKVKRVSDESLVVAAICGDQKQFGLLVERYQKAVLGLICSHVGNLHDSQDIAQETFIAAFKHLSDLKRPDRFGSWLKQIAVNKARTFMRSRAAFICIQPDETDLSCAKLSLIVEDDQRLSKGFIAALNTLSPANREAVFLSTYLGVNPKDGARILGISRQAFDTRICRGLKALRKGMLAVMRRELEELGLVMETYLSGFKEKIAEVIKSGEPKEKKVAARELRLLASRANIDLLIEDLKDEDSSVRRAAARLSGETGDIRLVRPLIETLSNEQESQTISEIIRSLESIGDPSALGTIEEIKRQAVNLDVITACSKAIANLKKADSGAARDIPLTIDALMDTGIDMILMKLLEDADGSVVSEALIGLGRLRYANALPAATKLALDPRRNVRLAAVTCIKDIGKATSETVQALETALSDTDTGVVVAAGRGLLALKCCSSFPLLFKIIEESKPGPIPWVIGPGIAKLVSGDISLAARVIPEFIRIAKAETSPIYTVNPLLYAISLAATPGYTASNDALFELLEAESVKRLSTMDIDIALAKSGESRGITRLIKHLGSDSRFTRKKVSAILASTDEGCSILLRCICDPGTPIEARVEAIDALENLGTERVLKDLEAIGESDDKRLSNRLRLAKTRLKREGI